MLAHALRHVGSSTARCQRAWQRPCQRAQTPFVRAMSTPYSAQGPGSDQLRQKGCGGACSRDTPKVSPSELDEYMKALPAWHLSPEKTELTRTFTAKNFVAAINFFNKVMAVAEEEGHHPDLHLRNFREVEVNVLTHAVGGITMADLVLAAKLDALEVEYSPKWVKQQQEAQQAQ